MTRRWPRRLLALSGVASVAVGLVLLPQPLHHWRLRPAIPADPEAGVTVRGPRMVNPNTINSSTGAAKLYTDRAASR